jgi:hypothetical protein
MRMKLKKEFTAASQKGRSKAELQNAIAKKPGAQVTIVPENRLKRGRH